MYNAVTVQRFENMLADGYNDIHFEQYVRYILYHYTAIALIPLHRH